MDRVTPYVALLHVREIVYDDGSDFADKLYSHNILIDIETTMVKQQKAISVNQGPPIGFLLGCFGRIFGFVFCSMFFGIGCLFLWMIAIQPMLKIQAAKKWVETPCTITKSEVKGNDSYKVVIEYDYDFNGQQFHGDQYNFFDMSTGGRTSKERVVAKYKEGSQKSCYVDPDNPSDSVINRKGSGSLWWGLFPIPFILIGLVGYWAVFFGSSKFQKKLESTQEALEIASVVQTDRTVPVTTRFTSKSDWSDSNYDEEDLFEEPGAVTLKNEASPFGLAVFLFFFAAFWNGIISVFLFERVGHWQRGDFGFEDLFLVPFVLVGMGLILAFIYNVMAGFNPKPVLVLSRQLIPLGGIAELDWRFPSSIGSIRNLKLTLIGLEEATYRRGTNTHTDHETFYEEIILDTSDPLEMSSGTVEVNIPADSMHSFGGAHNKVIWRLEMKGDIPLWPDVSAKFPIRVVPHE